MQIEIVPGDITAQIVDVVVNAANSSLLGGGGVDGAIHAAAGPALLAECRELRKSVLPQGLEVGAAVATGAGAMAARWVVHTVGPNRHAGQRDPELLTSCFRSCMLVAAEIGARSVAFPAISAGAYGWDVTEVAVIAVAAVHDIADGGQAGSVELVRFVPFGPAAVTAFETAVGRG